MERPPPSVPTEKLPSYLEVWQSDEAAVELGPGGTSHHFTSDAMGTLWLTCRF